MEQEQLDAAEALVSAGQDLTELECRTDTQNRHLEVRFVWGGTGGVMWLSFLGLFFFGGPTGTQRLDRFAYISFAKMLFSFEVWALNFWCPGQPPMSKCASRNLAPAQGQLAEMVELHAKAEETVDALSEAGKSIAVWGPLEIGINGLSAKLATS